MRLTSRCGRSGRSDLRSERISPGAERARVPRQRRRGFVAPRAAELRHYVMCPPVFLDETPPATAFTARTTTAMGQWERLRTVLIGLGHRVSLVPGRPGLPDMVFASRAATVVGGRVLGARPRAAARSAETPAYLEWFARHGFRSALEPVFAHEGESDLIPVGPRLLAAVGPLTESAAHAEAQAFFGLPVVPLELADPRFPRLGSALTVLGEHTAAYYPGAFTPTALRRLTRVFPERIEVDEADAAAFGLDAVSDGRSVVMGDTTPALAARLTERGFRTIELDMSAFAAHGASVRGCVLELRAAR
ncbi:dimethylarginine dimethylaminohydrolase family protein [Embleya hyalina]|uniref:Amidinotransferase n=1 Tax=Embleya hyalina TaxID=516124 RepID=A0A401YLE6_9ACTN|nr:amidinotransferase [Embleya hyalina]GCD95418.1 amidinotransferase [Embleya hyalina]